ncbi:hypothetical protein Dimus_018422 [Dionaea muscipula]
MEHPMGEEAEMPIPINSTYGQAHAHMIQHHHHHHHEPPPQPYNHIFPSSSSVPSNGNTTSMPEEAVVAEQAQNHKKQQQQQQLVVVKYRECLKNHAAAMGGNATDGCGEFMPSGQEGTIEALTCSACNCHRNFHRKEVEGELPSPSSCDCYHLINRGVLSSRKLITLPRHHHHHHHNHHSSSSKAMLAAAPEHYGYSAGGGALVPAARSVPIMPFSSMAYLPSESDEQEEGGGGGGGSSMGRTPTHQVIIKKRFRTKFTQEQKEKMFDFAEKVGWKIQKQEESVVQQFCQELGIKRRVLKVWMHNNKHNLAKKNNSTSTA